MQALTTSRRSRSRAPVSASTGPDWTPTRISPVCFRALWARRNGWPHSLAPPAANLHPRPKPGRRGRMASEAAGVPPAQRDGHRMQLANKFNVFSCTNDRIKLSDIMRPDHRGCDFWGHITLHAVDKRLESVRKFRQMNDVFGRDAYRSPCEMVAFVSNNHLALDTVSKGDPADFCTANH
jgi:hypothetical protein